MEIAKKRMQTCCFTGHRHLPPEEQAEIASRLECVISAQYQKGMVSRSCTLRRSLLISCETAEKSV